MSVINRNPVVETKGPADRRTADPAVEAGDASSTEVIGRIHSVETCGTVDGPGIRFIVFMQGCLMRCKYCHNRDTWDTQGGREVTVPELMKDLTSYRHFAMNASGGGVTASGGEAMLQQEFIAELFTACKAQGSTPAWIPTVSCATTTSCSIGCSTTPIWCCSTSSRSTTRSTFRLPTSATSIPWSSRAIWRPAADHVDPLRGGAHLVRR